MQSKLVLRNLEREDEVSFRHAVREFEYANKGHVFAFEWKEDCHFEEYLELIQRRGKGDNLKKGFVPASFYVAVVDGKVVGRVSIRHELNDFLKKFGGHIGYGVIPSEENKGYATEMLRQALEVCRNLGLQKVLLTCDVDNIASQRVIEKCGGEFENITDMPELEKQKRRYWFNLNDISRKADSPEQSEYTL